MIGVANFKSLVLILLTPVDLLFEKLQIWSNTKSGVMASNLKHSCSTLTLEVLA